jgi:hypothetical protein
MTPRHRFVLATASAVLVGTVVVLFGPGPEAGRAHPGTPAGTHGRIATRTDRRPSTTADLRSLPRPSADSRRTDQADALPWKTAQVSQQAGASLDGSFVVKAPKGASMDLQARAARVQAEAREKLSQLVEHYQLSPEQQAEIFPMLASSSASFDPRLAVLGGAAGSSKAPAAASPAASKAGIAAAPTSPTSTDTSTAGASVADRIHSVLQPTQQLALAAATVDSQLPAATDSTDEKLWWQEIIAQLKDELDQTIASSEAPSDSLSDLLGTTAVTSLPAESTDGTGSQTPAATEAAPEAPSDDLSSLLGQ